MKEIKGLNPEDYRSWIDSEIELDDDLKCIFENFVIGTPACGLSKKARTLFDYYEYRSLSEYSELKNKFLHDIEDLCFSDTFEKLKDAMLCHDFIGFKTIPSDFAEVVFIYIGDFHNNSNKLKSKFSAEEYEGLNRFEIAQIKRDALSVDKLFAHIRNSLAHGSFAVIDKKERYIFFQDESPNGISARMVLKVSTLKQWIKILDDRDNELKLAHLSEEKEAS